MSSTVTLVGNATADPELRFFEGGTAKATFSIAVNRYWTDDSGEKKEQTSFFNIVAWRNLAEDTANVLQKGVGVIVTGRLEQRSWDDEATGAKRSVVEVVADDVAIRARSIESYVRKQNNASAPQGSTTPKPKIVAKKVASQPQVFAEEEEPF